jgi:L-lactate dehydrogenase complex protein LldE
MRVQLMITCLIDSFFPEVGEAVVEVLTQAGATISFPERQTCCGQPAFNTGHAQQARQLAARTLEVFGGQADPVVVPSGSCAAMLRHGYEELFADEPAWLRRARDLAGRTYEFSEFLVEQLRVVELGAGTLAALAYHPSCHLLRGLGVDRQPAELLSAVNGPPVERLEPECCGFGGAFSVDHSEISEAMLDRKLQEIEAAGVEAVVGCDVSCLMHLEGGLRRRGSPVRCAHLSQVLASREPGLR